MSDMPAKTLSKLDRSQQTHPQHRPSSSTWSPHVDSKSTTVGITTDSKRMATSGPSSPRTPYKRPWDFPPERSYTVTGPDSAEEDEISDETSPNLQGAQSPRHNPRTAVSKRKEPKAGPAAPSPKRSKRLNVELSPTTRISDASHSKEAHSRSPSPGSRMRRPSAEHGEGSGAGQPSQQLLSLEEIETFLDLIYRHHPEPMTTENMRKSVDALYHDWEQYCAHRQAPVRLAKKPLMDEYGKIFNGVYGPEYQAKARSIAHELSQRAANASLSGDAPDGKESQRRDSSSRCSLTRSSTEEDSDDEEADGGNDVMDGDADASVAPSLAVKKKVESAQGAGEGQGSGSSKKSNIAQVGRNGLAVLPPGLFDILRNHLRDDILSSIMPSVRNDLTEQTRELFLQNQDLFGRIKEMEDRIRNQDLWIRHLLSRDTSDMTTPPVGPPMGANTIATGIAGGELGSGSSSKSRPFSASARDQISLGRQIRHGPSSSESDLGGIVSAGDYFGGAAPASPRQAPRKELRHFPPQGMGGSHAWEGRSPTVVAGPVMGAGPGSSNAFGSGRWEAEGPALNAYRDRPPPERRPSYTNEALRRPGSWQGERQAVRGFRSHNYPGERSNLQEGRYEPPVAPQQGNTRRSFAEHRRFSAFSGGAGGPRGAAPVPYPLSAGSGPSMGGMQSEFRRPGPPKHPRESAVSPISPVYDTRRPYPGLPVSYSEPHFGSSEPIQPPLPPRGVAAGSPEPIPKNKRGRPSKAEMAKVDLAPANRGTFTSN